MRKWIKIIVTILAVLVALMLLIQYVEPIQKAMPEAVNNFVAEYANYFLSALMLVVGILIFSSAPVIGIAFIIIGAIVLYTNLTSKKKPE